MLNVAMNSLRKGIYLYVTVEQNLLDKPVFNLRVL